MAKARPYISLGNVPMHSEKYVVLGFDITRWDSNPNVSAANQEFLEIADENIHRLNNQVLGKKRPKGQAVAGSILEDLRVSESMKFLSTDKKIRAQKKNLRLYLFDPVDDKQTLKTKLKVPIDSLMKTICRKGITDPFKELRKEIANFDDTLAAFLTLSTSNHLFRQCLEGLEKAQGKEDKTEWSKQWAFDLKEGTPIAIEHNFRRHALLHFVRKVCNMGLDRNGYILKELREKFSPALIHDLKRLCHVCFPMARAYVLYYQYDPTNQENGCHWYTDEDTHLMIMRAVIESEAKGHSTLDWHYLALVRSGLLGDFGQESLMPYLQPARRPPNAEASIQIIPRKEPFSADGAPVDSARELSPRKAEACVQSEEPTTPRLVETFDRRKFLDLSAFANDMPIPSETQAMGFSVIQGFDSIRESSSFDEFLQEAERGGIH